MTTRKQKVWLEEYLRCFNATEAARRAGYAWPNKSGPLNLKVFEKEIQERIEELTMSSEEVLARLSEIARGEYADYILPSGELDVEAMVEDGKAHLIHKMRPTRYGDSYEFYDAQKALVDIGRHFQLFTDRVDVTTKGEQVKAYTVVSPDDWPE